VTKSPKLEEYEVEAVDAVNSRKVAAKLEGDEPEEELEGSFAVSSDRCCKSIISVEDDSGDDDDVNDEVVNEDNEGV